MVSDIEEKANILKTALYPKPPEADLTDIEQSAYCEPISLPHIEEREVSEILHTVKPEKAPGSDQITNRILKAASEVLVPILTKVFNASLDLQYCPTHFKNTITVVLRKPAKKDYSDPKAYRPIALMNTLGKIMDSILAKRIAYIAEQYQLLPHTHCGGRKARSTEHAIHLLVEKIYATWRSPETPVASLLMLDVSGAFDNVSHQRLLHNLRKRRIPPELVGWIGSYLTGRSTSIRLQEGMTSEFDIQTGIPQGSPLSPILYLFYNADLLDIAGDGAASAPEHTALITGYVDDTSILVTGTSTEANNALLQRLHIKAEDWAAKRASKFAPGKYELIHFVNEGRGARTIDEPDRDLGLTLANGEVQTVIASKTSRYLGVILDPALNGRAHINHICDKVNKAIGALTSLAGSTWGASLTDLRTLYMTTILPKMTYGCTTWFVPGGRQGFKRQEDFCIQKLAQLQHRAMRLIAGAFRTTAKAALQIELNIAPIKTTLTNTISTAYLRMRESPLWNTLLTLRKATTTSNEIQGQINNESPLQKLENTVNKMLGSPSNESENLPIEPALPYVVPPWWDPPRIHIDGDWATAIWEHDRIAVKEQTGKHIENLICYTDGSEINAQVGAAAIIPAINRVAKSYLGSREVSTVFAGELQGIHQALTLSIHYMDEILQHIPKITVFTDNQAAIRSAARPGNQSGQHILDRIVRDLRNLRRRGTEVEIRWIPAHKGVPSNEAADTLAKEAAGWSPEGSDKGTKGPSPVGMARLRAACKRRIRSLLRQQWIRDWEHEATGRHLYKSTKTPSGERVETYRDLPKAVSTMIIQLKTGKIGFKAYLYTIGAADDDRCECGGRQKIVHIVQECPQMHRLRQKNWPEGPN